MSLFSNDIAIRAVHGPGGRRAGLMLLLAMTNDIVVDDEDLPIYSLLYVANFTALPPGPKAKTPDYTCSNNYGKQFSWRIGQLTQRISGPSSLALRAISLPNCAASNIGIEVSSYDEISRNYSSQYSRVRFILSLLTTVRRVTILPPCFFYIYVVGGGLC